MPFPIILVDSATGSDTTASGAGPATALSGTTNAATDAAGLVVTLPASTVLSGVATDGSHCLFLDDSTAGARNFGKITATAGSGGATPTVTVSDAFGSSLSGKSWAIGGRRATFYGTASRKLCENNAGAGDAMPGWAIEMQSGHAETIAATVNTRRAGNTTSGAITVRGVAGAATRPVLTFSAGGNGFVPRGHYQVFRSFDVLDTNGHTLTVFNCGTLSYCSIVDLRAADPTNYPAMFVDELCQGSKVAGCKVRTGGKGIRISAVPGAPATVEGCDLRCGNTAIDASGCDPLGLHVVGNLIHETAGVGILVDLAAQGIGRSITVSRNTVDGCTGGTSDGIQVAGGTAEAMLNLRIEDNLLTNNGRYGLNFASASVTDGLLSADAPLIRNNNTYNNASGAYKSATAGYAYNACPWAIGDPGADPTYTSGSDWTPTNTAVRAAGSVAGYP
jgi:hypothetical protein